MVYFEIYDEEWPQIPPEPSTFEDYPGDPCENLVKPSKRQMEAQDLLPEDLDENGMVTCGGRLRWVGQQHHYNGHYDCLTVTVECEFCGVYDFEAV